MNVIQVQNALKNVPDEALVNYVQNPSTQVPQYLALAELQRRKSMRTQAQSARVQPEASVADEAVSGIAGVVRDDMYNNQAFAGGGIVSFDEGGAVDMGDYIDWARWNKLISMQPSGGRTPPIIPQAQPTIPTEGGVYNPFADPFITGAIGGGEKPQFRLQSQQLMDKVFEREYPRLGGDKQKSSATIPRTTPTVTQPTVPERMSAMTNQPATGAPRPPMGGVAPSRTAAGGRPAGISALSRPQQNPLTWNKLSDNSAAYDAMMEPDTTAEVERNAFRAALGTNEGLAGLKERLAKLDASSQSQKDRAPWMALVQAGLGMAAGQSPNAITNIAEGAKQGMAAFNQAQERINEMEEKRFNLAEQLAQAQRQEEVMIAKFGEDSAQAKKAQRRTVQLAQLNNKNEIDLTNTKGAFEAAKANADIGLKRDEMTQRVMLEREKMANDRGIASIRAASGMGSVGGMSKGELAAMVNLTKQQLTDAKDTIANIKKDFRSRNTPEGVAALRDAESRQQQAQAQIDYLMGQLGVPTAPVAPTAVPRTKADYEAKGFSRM